MRLIVDFAVVKKNGGRKPIPFTLRLSLASFSANSVRNRSVLRHLILFIQAPLLLPLIDCTCFIHPEKGYQRKVDLQQKVSSEPNCQKCQVIVLTLLLSNASMHKVSERCDISFQDRIFNRGFLFGVNPELKVLFVALIFFVAGLAEAPCHVVPKFIR